jgi:Cu2+-exporting ATPase
MLSALLVGAAGSAAAALTIRHLRSRQSRFAWRLRLSQRNVGLRDVPDAALGRIGRATRSLFSHERQQQAEALGAGGGMQGEVAIERRNRRDLAVSATGFGFATIAQLGAPVLLLPSLLCTLYSTRLYGADSWRVWVEQRRIDYRLLWAASIGAALIAGFIWVAAFGTLFGTLNRYLVARTELRSKRQITDLFGGEVRSAWVVVDGVEIETPIEQVQAGDRVAVHAGETIPVDGEVIAGSALVDQHLLTGEAQPADKGVGDDTLAGAMVLAGRLQLRVRRSGKETVAAQVAALLEQTTDFKRVLQSRTDRLLNSIALPLLALSALALPLLGVAGALAVLWYYPGARMMVFGPLTMLSYLQAAAQRGILVKDGRALETLREVDMVLFDKTGTLTLEVPTVVAVEPRGAMTEVELLRLAAAAESRQGHPIARAIVAAARERGLEPPILDDSAIKAGLGIEARIDGTLVRVGNERYMDMEGVPIPAPLRELQGRSHASGQSLVLVARDETIAGSIVLAPTIRPEAKQVIAALHRRGIETAIISGDHPAPTRHLAEQLGIDRVHAEVLPQEKARLVETLRGEGRRVCFIGDGINDAIALKAADVAISLRGATSIALDTAEIIFADGTLVRLPDLLDLVDALAATMRVNLAATIVPSSIGIVGTFLFGWSMLVCVLIVQGSLPVGVYSALRPLLDGQTRPGQGDSPQALP